jgi:hypothetical protein
MTHEVWIGLAEARQRPGAGVLLDRNEAAVNVLANASDVTEFRQAVYKALDELGFDLVDLEDPAPLRARRAQFEVSSDLIALGEEVRRDGSTRFGTFHTWVSDKGAEPE